MSKRLTTLSKVHVVAVGEEPVIVHQQQPTRWSCGVACAAMLTHQPFGVMLQALPMVRISITRRRLRRPYINVGELRRLLVPYNLTMGTRAPGRPNTPLAILRVPNGTCTGWHWCVWSAGVVHDPLLEDGCSWETYHDYFTADVSYYPVRMS